MNPIKTRLEKSGGRISIVAGPGMQGMISGFKTGRRCAAVIHKTLDVGGCQSLCNAEQGLVSYHSFHGIYLIALKYRKWRAGNAWKS